MDDPEISIPGLVNIKFTGKKILGSTDKTRPEYDVKIYCGSLLLFDKIVKGRNAGQAAWDSISKIDANYEVSSVLVDGEERLPFLPPVKGDRYPATANIWFRLDVWLIRLIRKNIPEKQRSTWVTGVLLKAMEEQFKEKKKGGYIMPKKNPHAFLERPEVLEKPTRLEME